MTIKHPNQPIILSLLFFACLFSRSTQASWNFQIEAAPAWQTSNEQAVPGSTGDRFNISQFNDGPFPTFRIYLGKKWNDRHEWRFLYAPLKLSVDGEFKKSVQFQDVNFSANTPTKATYQFNSYRLTYAYQLEPRGDWNLKVGFTGKIRDAEVSLKQSNIEERKTNIGFVPLFHFQAARPISEKLTFKVDFDGLAAPQGRAIDLALFIERPLDAQNQFIFGGYRTVEGGADNDTVYNFAWFHYLTLGWKIEL